MNGMKGIVQVWIYPAIIFVLMAIRLFPGSTYVIPGYDLDRDGFGEFILINDTSIQYVEMANDFGHNKVWSKSFDDLPFLIHHSELVNATDSSAQLLVFSGTTASSDNEAISTLLNGFLWSDSSFSNVPIPLVSGNVNGDRFRPGHIAFSETLNLAAVAANSPSRNVMLYKPGKDDSGFALMHKIETISMHNGLGKIMCEWFGPRHDLLLAVFSIESDSIVIDVFQENSWDQPAYSGKFGVPPSPILSNLILSRDLSGDGFADVLMPFENDHVYALSVVDSILSFSLSDISREGLFTLPDSATSEGINTLFAKQISAGLLDPDFMLLFESGFPDSVDLAFIDTISVGDTISISVSPDSSAGFYSFRWTRRPPQSSYFDPLSGSIQWIPSEQDIGHHIISYAYQVRIREFLLEDTDEFGDRHQIVPMLAAGDSTWGIVVIDSAGSDLPPVIYPQFEKRMFSVAVRTDQYDSTAYDFTGVPSYILSTEILPGRSGLHHSISTNIAALPIEDEISFLYESSAKANNALVTLTLIHDLNSNVLSAALNPALDSLPQTFYPGDWDYQLSAYPEYLFQGFKQDIIMDSLEQSIVFHTADTDLQKQSFTQWIEVVAPSRPDHVMRIFFYDGSLQNISGTVRFRDDGSATTVAEFNFSEEFYPAKMMSNMIHSDQDSIRTKVIPAVRLERRTTSENSEISDS